MKIQFKKGEWEDKFFYSYTYRFVGEEEFTQNEDNIQNQIDNEKRFGCDHQNISIFLKKKYKVGTEISTVCSFEDIAAPLVVIAEDVYDENGISKYGNYYEVVIWKNGINIWQMNMVDKEVKWKLLTGVTFKLKESKKHKLSVKFEKSTSRMIVTYGKMVIKTHISDMKEKYYVGIDACEGICKFYNFEVKNKKTNA